ncbi:uncharacterized protein BO80DRAFT_416959 [Aspergillus ibericus CBS 121593]|uniref:DUF7580 domain-containing protein n=1 Tax=Aspergillus ibericus CBS 121593 TaxID=1448316 RepID=A0A395GLM3_9EURO|nr:hypothetical protein BO80DRAFT_416959 [Aspergillus ibericus CBS 121593]RAK96410.1 hypothetical protein BO80DRAFT_416959 [Aspergillus ibericus CBS 121593]
MEAIGFALAILPFLINQLDNHVQGLETLKTFRAKRYRRELDGYLSSLGTQQAIFLNTLEQCLDGVVDHEDGIGALMSNPLGNLWKSPAFDSRLREKLGRNYAPFMRTMADLSDLLDSLSKKLKWDTETSVETAWNRSSALEREVKKFRDIFSKSIYNDLSNRIHIANTILRTLMDQSDRCLVMRKRRISKRSLLRHRAVRKSAYSLHHAMFHGTCWNCACRDQHFVQFQLNTPLLDTLGASDDCSNACFRMVFASQTTVGSSSPWNHWHEVEAESNNLQPKATTVNSPPNMHPHVIASGKRKQRVRFTSVPSTQDDVVSIDTGLSPSATPIIDICSALSTMSSHGGQRIPIGYLSDGSHQHTMYHVRNIASSLRPRSLEDLIQAAPSLVGMPAQSSFKFSRRDRLHLALSLACSVLELHGSWLKSFWRARDILFTTPTMIPSLLWDMSNDSCTSLCGETQNKAVLIRNETLFPLGLVLVELSLCQTLEALHAPEDDDPIEAVAKLKTAARHIPSVETESGGKYAQVVDRCLFWSGTQGLSLEHEQMQDEVFQFIIIPLMENLRAFEGKA